jgi:hypothetical protein
MAIFPTFKYLNRGNTTPYPTLRAGSTKRTDTSQGYRREQSITCLRMLLDQSPLKADEVS